MYTFLLKSEIYFWSFFVIIYMWFTCLTSPRIVTLIPWLLTELFLVVVAGIKHLKFSNKKILILNFVDQCVLNMQDIWMEAPVESYKFIFLTGEK